MKVTKHHGKWWRMRWLVGPFNVLTQTYEGSSKHHIIVGVHHIIQCLFEIIITFHMKIIVDNHGAYNLDMIIADKWCFNYRWRNGYLWKISLKSWNMIMSKTHNHNNFDFKSFINEMNGINKFMVIGR
jgi:hypothetical protein